MTPDGKREQRPDRKLGIYVHRASECLTDHLSHGDGLICYSLLNGLAERGHSIDATADRCDVCRADPRLRFRAGRTRTPIHSLVAWETAWRADRRLSSLASAGYDFDLVWRMHPWGEACPRPPRTLGRPLVVGPLFYSWPIDPAAPVRTGRPRLGVGIAPLLRPAARSGWRRTLRAASLILCATPQHVEQLRRQCPWARVELLPVIVDAPPALVPGGTANRPRPDGPPRLLFVGNLVANKNPRVVCDAVGLLRRRGVGATATLLGDGPERASLEAHCRSAGLADAVHFAGRVPNDQVYRRVADADFLVSTSLGEPYGRNIAEAMSVGTPAVCHRSGGPADFVEHGTSGLLVENLDAADYAAAVAAAWSQPGAWRRLSAGAARAAESWTSRRVLDRLEVMLFETVRRCASRRAS